MIVVSGSKSRMRSSSGSGGTHAPSAMASASAQRMDLLGVMADSLRPLTRLMGLVVKATWSSTPLTGSIVTPVSLPLLQLEPARQTGQRRFTMMNMMPTVR